MNNARDKTLDTRGRTVFRKLIHPAKLDGIRPSTLTLCTTHHHDRQILTRTDSLICFVRVCSSAASRVAGSTHDYAQQPAFEPKRIRADAVSENGPNSRS